MRKATPESDIYFLNSIVTIKKAINLLILKICRTINAFYQVKIEPDE